MPHWSRLIVSIAYQTGAQLPGLTCKKGSRNPEIVDPALSPIGQEQMSHLAVKLRAEFEQGLLPPTKVFTSVTVRTCQSAVEVWRNVLGREVPIVAMQVSVLVFFQLGFIDTGRISEIPFVEEVSPKEVHSEKSNGCSRASRSRKGRPRRMICGSGQEVSRIKHSSVRGSVMSFRRFGANQPLKNVSITSDCQEPA
jgi:hypothetical protein